MNPDAAKAAHLSQAMALILAAAQSPDPTQPPARVGEPRLAAVPDTRGRAQQQDEGNDDERTQR